MLVNEGLFSTAFRATDCDIDGRSLYLGMQVEDDPEMTPRTFVDNVPYAWSLRPGARIYGAVTESPRAAIEAWNSATSGYVYGIRGGTYSPDGEGVFGAGSGDATGLYGRSDSGTAIQAGGTGIIQSSATSRLWISGNGVRPQHESDSTVIDLDSIGGAIITPGVAMTPRYVMLPVTVVSPLSGQDVKVTALEIFWAGDTHFDAITDIRLRRQTGVCNSCFVDIIHDSEDHVCPEEANAEGCTISNYPTTNNVLTRDSGILYLMMQVRALETDSWIRVGGARLKLEHD